MRRFACPSTFKSARETFLSEERIASIFDQPASRVFRLCTTDMLDHLLLRLSCCSCSKIPPPSMEVLGSCCRCHMNVFTTFKANHEVCSDLQYIPLTESVNHDLRREDQRAKAPLIGDGECFHSRWYDVKQRRAYPFSRNRPS